MACGPPAQCGCNGNMPPRTVREPRANTGFQTFSRDSTTSAARTAGNGVLSINQAINGCPASRMSQPGASSSLPNGLTPRLDLWHNVVTRPDDQRVQNARAKATCI